MRLKYLQLAQYESWLRKATDHEWDEDESRSKPERAAVSFALELRDAAERIASLEAALREKDSQLHDVCEKLADSDVDYLEAQVKALQDADRKQTAELAQARAEIAEWSKEGARRSHERNEENDSLRSQLPEIADLVKDFRPDGDAYNAVLEAYRRGLKKREE